MRGAHNHWKHGSGELSNALLSLCLGCFILAGGCTTPAAVAGYPHITVPAGFYGGLPIGLSFFGTAWSEPTLLKLAYAWEQETKARRKPAFAPR